MIRERLLAITMGVVVLAALGWFASSQPQGPTQPHVVVPPAGEISVQGEMVCLPHKDKGNGEPHTLECGIGLRDNEGRYFALRDSDPSYRNISSGPMGVRVEVKGTFTANSDSQYDIVGVIDVESLLPADVPRQATLAGSYVCLPHKDTSGPQTDECAIGIHTDQGEYHALDFRALSLPALSTLMVGDKIRVEGTLVPIEQISSDQWQKYLIKGIMHVTNLVKL